MGDFVAYQNGNQNIPVTPTNPLPVSATVNATVSSLSSAGAQVSNTPTVTAGAYSAGNVMGGVMTLANALPANFLGTLQSLALKFKGSVQTGVFQVALFSASPSGTFADKGAPAIAAGDSALLLGIYPLGTPISALGTHTIYNLDGIAKQLVGSSTSLYAVVIAVGAPTNPASTSDMTLTVGVLW